ncbi:sialic acid-binding Ig-like lectin 14 isoform X3 [Carassius gibelio]|uniref:sialic acid-binding Ig-like lectin 14 isoform X3 n=1 Tax=Carassius gibelio TaxID=101364 RepID=UPI002278E851|nr:sialic acid-binding Ig-like lectin 14 isoform X3 [Carassius gibelio]
MLIVSRVQSSMAVRSSVLLYWFHVFCAGVFADVWKVTVEPEMQALVSSCVVLPCSFKYPVQEQPTDRIRAMWHKKDNWDDIIFHKDPTRVKDSFKGRTNLIGSLGGSNCSLEIDEVKNHDNGPYCFRVELETSKKDKYSFVENCVSIKMIEQASKPELQAEHSVQEGEPAVFTCSVRHTCPSHQPTLTWNHTGKVIMSYKNIGHGNWETQSVLTFSPKQEDDHSTVACTVKHHGNVKGEMTATHRIFVKGFVQVRGNRGKYPAASNVFFCNKPGQNTSSDYPLGHFPELPSPPRCPTPPLVPSIPSSSPEHRELIPRRAPGPQLSP